jgi:hypothetical protein
LTSINLKLLTALVKNWKQACLNSN